MKNKVRWGILATGRIAHKFASDIQLVDNCRLCAVASRDKAKSDAFAERYGIEKAYGSYAELAHDPDVDIIYIATPHTLHCENTLMCLDADKHVLCEKPLGMNSSEVRRMVAKAKEKHLFLMEALWTRFIPSYMKFRELALDGSIGKIKLIHADFAFTAPNDPNHRLLNKRLGGGALLDVGIYPVFLALDLMGLPDTIASKAIITPDRIDEVTTMLFEYRQKQSIASLSSSLAVDTPVEACVYGTGGSIRLNGRWHAPSSVELSIDGKKETYTFDEPGIGYQYEITVVNQCLQENKTESELFPLQKSIELHRTLDDVRAQIGLDYEADHKSS